MAMDEYKEWLLPDERQYQGQMQIVPKEFHPFQHGNKSLEKSCTWEKAPKYGASCGKRN